jgi:hypothetical protein
MFLPIIIVEIGGSNPDVDRDIDAANVVWGSECEVFVDVIERLTVDRPNLLTLTQDDCNAFGHVVSDEEDELYSLGRGRGADVVGYYIRRSAAGSGILGCAAHPPGRRGFWVQGTTPDQFVLAHEAAHVVGNNSHVFGNTDNLMTPFSPGTNPPPDLIAEQCQRIVEDPAILSVESIVLNL